MFVTHFMTKSPVLSRRQQLFNCDQIIIAEFRTLIPQLCLEPLTLKDFLVNCHHNSIPFHLFWLPTIKENSTKYGLLCNFGLLINGEHHIHSYSPYLNLSFFISIDSCFLYTLQVAHQPNMPGSTLKQQDLFACKDLIKLSKLKESEYSQ